MYYFREITLPIALIQKRTLWIDVEMSIWEICCINLRIIKHTYIF